MSYLHVKYTNKARKIDKISENEKDEDNDDGDEENNKRRTNLKSHYPVLGTAVNVRLLYCGRNHIQISRGKAVPTNG